MSVCLNLKFLLRSNRLCYRLINRKIKVANQYHSYTSLKLIDNRNSSLILQNKQLTFKEDITRNYSTKNKNKKYSGIHLHNSHFKNMILIKYDEKAEKLGLTLKCKVGENHEREFNLNRNLDEEIGATFAKLYTNYTKQVAAKGNKSKKLKTNENENENENKPVKKSQDDQVPIFLYDLDNNLVPPTTKNKDAWKENFTFKIVDQEFKVIVNLPTIKKIALSKLLIAGMPAVVKIETDSQISNEQLSKFSKFSWYKSVNTFENPIPDTINSEKIKLDQNQYDKLDWALMAEGENKRLCVLDEDCENRLIKIECIPNDGSREGLAVQHLTNYLVNKKLDLINFPMTDRHKLTKEKLTDNKYTIKSFFLI